MMLAREEHKGMKKKYSITLKIAAVLSAIDLILVLINIILQSNCIRSIVWIIVIVIFICDWIVINDTWKTTCCKLDFKDYEIDQLRYSYRQMGKYVARFDVTELHDLDQRIENELNDIEIRKSWYAESHGIKGN